MTDIVKLVGPEPVWIEIALVHAIHDRQLAEHGGLVGVRDLPALESALDCARSRWANGETDLCALAAAYAFGVARNHPFADGNKRTAWILARLFLRLNGVTIGFAPEDAIRTVLQLAAGGLSGQALTQWFQTKRA